MRYIVRLSLILHVVPTQHTVLHTLLLLLNYFFYSVRQQLGILGFFLPLRLCPFPPVLYANVGEHSPESAWNSGWPVVQLLCLIHISEAASCNYTYHPVR